MTDTTFRIHPTINFARVGGSEDYYIAPETAAGTKVDSDTGLMGGLPIKQGTEDTVIEADDYRDSGDRLRRQAARFRIFAYARADDESYPNGGGVEVNVGYKFGPEFGDALDGKEIEDIIWTVHVANKKANNYRITTPVKAECLKWKEECGDNKCVEKKALRDANGNFILCKNYSLDGCCDDHEVCKDEELGIDAYADGRLPPARNLKMGGELDNADRLRKLMIDPGPRAIASSTHGQKTIPFSRASSPTYADAQGTVHTIDQYPVSFPDVHFDMYNPQGKIDTLGELTIEANTGRLLVLGGFGRASALKTGGAPPPLEDAIDNDGWFDDCSDGPVNAVITFKGGGSATVHGAWVVTTDPSYAPQTRNVVSTWDDIYTTWVENLDLVPSLYSGRQYQASFQPSFDDDVMPIFHGAMLQKWNTNLPNKSVKGHELVGNITAASDPTEKIANFDSLIRDPNDASQADSGVRMPLALGDVQKSFLVLTPTQYFFLKQWHSGNYSSAVAAMGAGERMDRAVLENCLGGRYSPGIDLTFIVRQVDLYIQNWKAVGCGPFRINQEVLEYGAVDAGTPFLGVGYVPQRDSIGVQPGDVSKFMALPWHTDYNSCATHTPDPNPMGNNTLYWSWPAQRPVNVYPAQYCTYDSTEKKWYVGGQVFSVRGDEGEGTHSDYPQQQGRFQCYFDFVENWERVGLVIQGLQIPAEQGGNYGAENFLEVSSLFETEGDIVQPWPTATEDGYEAPCDCGPPDHHK